MCTVYLLVFLSLTISTSLSKGWWGNIHHLLQLISLANKEEYILKPVMSSIEKNLKSEILSLQHYLNKFRNLRHQQQYRKLNNIQNLNGKVKVLETKLKTILENWKETKVSSNEIFMSINSFLQIHHSNGIVLTTGFEYDTKAGGFLKLIHYLDIGMIALSKKFYYRAIEWTRNPKYIDSLNFSRGVVDLQSAIFSTAVQLHNRVFIKMRRNEYADNDLYDIYSNLYSRVIKYNHKQNNSRPKKRSKLDIFYPRKIWDLFDNHSLVSKFTELCNGKILQSPATTKNLNCYYAQQENPYFYVNPIKVEKLSENPPIFHFYEVHGNKTINYVKSFREVLINPKTLYGEDSQYKSFDDVGSTYARRSMQDHVHQNYPHFGKIMEYLTGFKIINVAGPLLWAEYIYGRSVAPHTDTRAGNTETLDQLLTFLSKGELLAVLMHYIDAPVQGGHTPFLQGGVIAPAIKGSAILWINSHRNGTTRNDVHHGGCPVLHGNKIIMLTPILYQGNWNQYKCSLNPKE